MTSADSPSVDQQFLKNAMASFLQIGAVVVLLYWCLTIVSPFLTIVIWGLIISIALYPAHVSLSARLGGREKTSATLLVLIGIAIIAVPMWLLADSTIGGLQHIAAELEDGTAEVPPPADSVAEWPVIGDKVHEVWTAAATNLEATLNKFAPQLRSAGQKALAFAGHTVGTAFQFVFSVIIAGVLLMSASGGYTTSRNIMSSLVGEERGPAFTDLSILTIRSVVKGVLGVALIPGHPVSRRAVGRRRARCGTLGWPRIGACHHPVTTPDLARAHCDLVLLDGGTVACHHISHFFDHRQHQRCVP